jgi:LemA protein
MSLLLVIGLIFLGAIVLAVILSIVNIYNRLVTVRNNVSKSWKNIDVLLKQRHDELPKLLSVVKAFMTHEKSLLSELTQARSEAISSKSLTQRQQAEDKISGLLNSLYAVSESYPQLRSSQNFIALQMRITGLENGIADRRELFNESVNNYNIRIESFPEILMARFLNYKKKELMNVPAADRRDVEMSFKNSG